MSVDPLAYVNHSIALSPYHYVAGNPISYIDPDGRDWYRNDETGEVHWQKGSDALDGHVNIGAEHIIESETSFIVHNQNEVVNTIKKSSLKDVSKSDVGRAALAASAVLLADDATGIGVADDIAIPVILAGALAYETAARTYVTYTLTNPSNGNTYSGRASGFGDAHSVMLSRYMGHHMRALGYSFPKLDRSAQGIFAYPGTRGREQQLIDFHGGAQSEGGTSGNRIRGVGKYNPLGRIYHDASNLYFGPLNPYTGNY